MAVGWAKDGAVQEQIDATIEDAVQLARSRIPEGVGVSKCEECDSSIPINRREAIPGVRYCIECQVLIEKKQTTRSYYNRSGSKDSQLK